MSTVGNYFDNVQWIYSALWPGNTLHYGLHSPARRTPLREAVAANNKNTSRSVCAAPGMLILDAGCGTGGTGEWISRNTGAHVHGITLSKKQLAKVKDTTLTSHSYADFCATPFDDKLFDGAYSIEAACYAQDKAAYCREMYRVLKPGARLAVTDAFLTDIPTACGPYTDMLWGWNIPHLADHVEFLNDLRIAGFTHVEFTDLTSFVEPSSRIIRRWGLAFNLMTLGGTLCGQGLRRHITACLAQGDMLKSGSVVYGSFVATRP